MLFGALTISPIGAIVTAIEEATPSELLIFRCIGITLFFVALLKLTDAGSLVAVVRKTGVPGLIAGFSMASALTLSMYAFQQTTVARTLLLFSTAPVLSGFLAWIFLGERVSLVKIVAIGLTVLGINIVVFGDADGQLAGAAGDRSGDAAALIGALMYATFTVALRAGRDIDMRPAMMLSAVIGLAIGLGVMGLQHRALSIGLADATLMVVVGFGLTGSAFLLFSIGSKVISAPEFTVFSLSEVFWGSLWAWLLLGQSVSIATAAGAVLFLTAVLIDAKYAR